MFGYQYGINDSVDLVFDEQEAIGEIHQRRQRESGKNENYV